MLLCITVSGCCCLSLSGDESSGSSDVPAGYNDNDDDKTATPVASGSATDHATARPTSSGTDQTIASPEEYGSGDAKQSDRTASDDTVRNAAQAIMSNDGQMLVGLMSKDTLGHVSGNPDLTTPQAAKLATGLTGAKRVIDGASMMTYEMTIDGTTCTFYTVKEGGTWKITGL